MQIRLSLSPRSVIATVTVVMATLTTTGWTMKSEPGLPVSKISLASQIESWQVIDRQRLIVNLTRTGNYLLTLRNQCHRLNSFSNLGVSSSNNTIYAGFDYITADGQRCAIRSISKLSGAEVKSLAGI